jgi:hypothetical protein
MLRSLFRVRRGPQVRGIFGSQTCDARGGMKTALLFNNPEILCFDAKFSSENLDD